MLKRQVIRTLPKICCAAVFSLCGSAVWAQMQPIGSPHGTVSGTIDGHEFDLPVRCETWTGALDVSSHDQPISNSTSTGGVEPALNIIGTEDGFLIVAFIGGTRYRFLEAGDVIETFPFTIMDELRDREHGEVQVDLTLECPSP